MPFFPLDRLKRIFGLRAVKVDAAAHPLVEQPHGACRLSAARVTEYADAAFQVNENSCARFDAGR